MVKPDVGMKSQSSGRIFYNGLIYDIAHGKTGWIITRPMDFEPIYTGDSVEDCCAWLMAQTKAGL